MHPSRPYILAPGINLDPLTLVLDFNQLFQRSMPPLGSLAVISELIEGAVLTFASPVQLIHNMIDKNPIGTPTREISGAA